MTAAPASDVAARLADVRQRIAAAGGDPSAVRVVAMTKGFGAEAVSGALAAGINDVGENYAQELLAKKAGTPAGGDVRWHFLGAIQRNKLARLAPAVTVWQSVDGPEAGAAIARRAPGATVLVQVNLSGRAGRNGCTWDEAPAVVDALRDLDLDVAGLMGVASVEPAAAAAEFGRLAALKERSALRELSIGMTDDLELAVRAGTTMVRIGRALFGPREKRPR